MIALPPARRSHAALGLTAAAARGRFELQQCLNCATVVYPAREMCRRCLSTRLRWRRQPAGGELLADTVIHHSNDPFFRARLPWRVGTVRLDAGPVALVHVHARCPGAPARVRVDVRLDAAGQGVLWAFPVEETANVNDDPRVREMSADPAGRRILVTDATSDVGHALVEALIAAGAQRVWMGFAPGRRAAAPDTDARSAAVPLALAIDVTDEHSLHRAAETVGAEVDLLINTADLQAAGAPGPVEALDAARREMDVNYFGLLRLAQEFAAPMRARAGTPGAGAAWVNLLAVEALAGRYPRATYAASKAAALSFTHSLRADLQGAGIRVVNVFPGPVGTEAGARTAQSAPLTAGALAAAIVQALRIGVEDVYPGEIAQDWLARHLEDPKILEREAAADRADGEVQPAMSDCPKIQ